MIKPSDILNGKILIVDDQEPNVLLLEQMLRGAGYTDISSTMNPAEVCERHLVNRYDLILLDLQMPGMDGFQVMENLKAIESGGYLPVLVITAQSDHKLRALKSGAKDFVSKPFDLAEVLLRGANMLEVRLLHLETLKLCDRILAEQKASERLLLDTLPSALAAVMKARPATAVAPGLIAESYAEVTVLFADLLAFTTFSEGAAAKALTGVLDAIASRVAGQADSPADRERILGDAYLDAVGLPDAVVDRTIGAANKALDLKEAVDRFNSHSRYQIKLQIGFETRTAGGARRRKQRHEL